MELVTFLVFSVGLATTCALKCDDVSGKWQNELGSRMVLHVDDSNRMSGEYYTAVEANPGAAAFVSNITGLFSRQSEGSILAFSVLFNHGSSLASWVGQCMVCDEKEVLHTTYMLRAHVKDPREKWRAVTVNHNTFWRLEEYSENEVADSSSTVFSAVGTLSVVSQKPPGGLELSGKWESNDNEEIEITGDDGHVFEGKHHSTYLTGRRDGSDVFTAVSLMSTSSKRIKSWTGHIYNSAVPQILEASWLEHEFNPSCTSGRNMVRFGVQNFTQTVAGAENNVNKSETFLDKLRKFFSSMF